ncbi:fasciclin domain-containing protein [Pontibacter aydingkolensis]|uniref:fasciclin domain-containing protein n=1 Tax=Pontibacter aydingkolensis TaxID=1911536 RepID=UPI0033959345
MRLRSRSILCGAAFTFYVNTSNLTLNKTQGRGANLVPAFLNVQATNGVVHLIDKVILPGLES